MGALRCQQCPVKPPSASAAAPVSLEVVQAQLGFLATYGGCVRMQVSHETRCTSGGRPVVASSTGARRRSELAALWDVI